MYIKSWLVTVAWIHFLRLPSCLNLLFGHFKTVSIELYTLLTYFSGLWFKQPTSRPEWIDVGLKSSPNFCQSCPKSSLCRLFKIALKVTNHLLKILLPRTFNNRPIWSHWSRHSILLVRRYEESDVAEFIQNNLSMMDLGRKHSLERFKFGL